MVIRGRIDLRFFRLLQLYEELARKSASSVWVDVASFTALLPIIYPDQQMLEYVSFVRSANHLSQMVSLLLGIL